MTSLQYDTDERLNEVDHPSTGETATTIAYYNDNSVETVTDNTGTTGYTYYLNGWLDTVTYNYTGLASPQTITYTYYPDGLCETMTWPAVGTWYYTYDGAGRMTTVTDPVGNVTHWTYDGAGRMRIQNNSNGTKTKWCIDNGTGFVTNIAHSQGLTPLASYGLDHVTYPCAIHSSPYHLHHRIIYIMVQDKYGYDALHRLTSEERTGTAQDSHSFGYDLAGNLNNQDGTDIYYDQWGQRASDTYDGDGNLETLGSLSLGWDDSSDLTSAGSQTYGYTADGTRVTSTDSSGNTTFYIYDGDQLLGEMSADGTPKAAYTWGASGLVTEYLPVQNKSLWYHFGPQGETRLLTDSTGAVVDLYTYSAYGQPVATTGTDPNPFGYGGSVGYYTDPVTALIYCSARWYDPTTSRWLSVDPIGFAGGTSVYAYAASNPVSQVDPYGLDSDPTADADPTANCQPLADEISELTAEIESRVSDMLADAQQPTDLQLYPIRNGPNGGVNPKYPNRGSWFGHQKQIRNKQARLRSLLKEWKDGPCGKHGSGRTILGNAWPAATIPAVTKPMKPFAINDPPMVDVTGPTLLPLLGAGAIGGAFDLAADGIAAGLSSLGQALDAAGQALAPAGAFAH